MFYVPSPVSNGILEATEAVESEFNSDSSPEEQYE